MMWRREERLGRARERAWRAPLLAGERNRDPGGVGGDPRGRALKVGRGEEESGAVTPSAPDLDGRVARKEEAPTHTPSNGVRRYLVVPKRHPRDAMEKF